MTQEIKKEEDWMQKKWRPAMGWTYMIICVLDMAVFPILWSVLQALLKQPITQWNPLTLQGAGLFHIAMGAVLGIAAFGRTQEKVAGAANNSTSAPMPTASPFSAPAPMPTASPFSAPAPVVAPAPVSTNFGSKAAPSAAPQPEL